MPLTASTAAEAGPAPAACKLRPGAGARLLQRARPLLSGLVVLVGALILIAGQLGCGSGWEGSAVPTSPSGWPLARDGGVIVSGYGEPRQGRLHQGIDISARKGDRVVATAPGLVVHAGRGSGGYGRLVVIDHGSGLETRYAHLASLLVEPADRVVRGTVIGKVGRSGNAASYHLHYEVRKLGQPVDPTPFLRR